MKIIPSYPKSVEELSKGECARKQARENSAPVEVAETR